MVVGLTKGHSESIVELVHILVARTFVPNRKNKPDVNHKDLNKKNNRSGNLEWCTKLENARHAIKNGVHKKGSRHWNSILTEKDIPTIRSRIKKGDCIKKIAEDYGVHPTTICDVKAARTWTHI